jgi:outer membrane protein TolC
VSVLQPSPFLGGVPTGTPTTEPIELTVTDAIRRALEHNLGLLNAENAVTRAHGSRWTALADLLPNVNGRITENRQRINLAAFGFPLPPGTPSLVGPFNVFDARVNVSQTVFDRRAIDEARAQGHAVRAAEHSVKSARELVVLVSANLYLQALAATARLESVQAQLQTAQAVFDQANDLKTAGLVAGIEVLRAEVQMSTQQQRVTAARNDLEIAKLQLARVVGLPPGQPFTISGELPFVPVPDMTVEAALERAYRARPDYLAAEERLRQAEAQRSAAGGEYLPSLRVNADYGAIGLSPADAEITYALSGVLNVPIFNGGRSRGRVMQADAELRTRQSELADLRAGIDFDVRSAFFDLQATSEQLRVAARARDLAGEQLTQARDRFSAGVSSNLEVVQAQEAVAAASERYIEALHGYNVAKALLARDLGIAEETAQQLLGGVR